MIAILMLGLWLLFLRTPDDGRRSPSSAASRDSALTPTYPSVPESPDGSSASPTESPSSEPAGSSSVTAVESPVTTGAASASDSSTSATITDPVGDRTVSADPPPPWADLAGATLTRSSGGFELRIRLGGGEAPSTTDSNHTMNIASYYDVDGDGTVDYEVWANLADTGWATSYFDDRLGKAAFKDQSGVAVSVDGDSVVLTFPLTHLADAATFRWSLASEWGPYAAIGSDLAARDEAPDNDQPASFPG